MGNQPAPARQQLQNPPCTLVSDGSVPVSDRTKLRARPKLPAPRSACDDHRRAARQCRRPPTASIKLPSAQDLDLLRRTQIDRCDDGIGAGEHRTRHQARPLQLEPTEFAHVSLFGFAPLDGCNGQRSRASRVPAQRAGLPFLAISALERPGTYAGHRPADSRGLPHARPAAAACSRVDARPAGLVGQLQVGDHRGQEAPASPPVTTRWSKVSESGRCACTAGWSSTTTGAARSGRRPGSRPSAAPRPGRHSGRRSSP